MKKTSSFDLGSTSMNDLLEGIAAKRPAPGGGAAAAALGALAASLGRMVVSFTEGKEEFADLLDPIRKSAKALDDQRREFMSLCDKDAEAFIELSRLIRRRPDDHERMQHESNAVRAVINVPLEGLKLALETAERLEWLAGKSNHHLRSDLAIGAVFAEAAAAACLWNVRINLPMLVDQIERSTLLAEGEGLLKQVAEKRAAIEAVCLEGW
ncbi:MAG: formiminotetrahydrofolate cyclodeaminase [Phycisphaerales bacterium]|jgi:formiminotetrahydrofolate cyclodeaminase